MLALATHADFLRYASVALYALLIAAWLTAAARTTRGSLNGSLFLPSPQADGHAHARLRPCVDRETELPHPRADRGLLAQVDQTPRLDPTPCVEVS